MSFMNENQVRLLHKLQMAEIPAFRNISPIGMSEEEAGDFFRMNLPALEWINAVAETEDHEFVERRFLGTSENNCKTQMQNWLDADNLKLFQQPNSQFGSGEMWLEYFSQPPEAVNLHSLKTLFHNWEIETPQVPIPKEQQKIDHYHPAVPPQDIYQRLTPQEQEQEIENLKAGKPLSAGVQFGFSPVDVSAFEEDTQFHTFLSPLKDLSKEEWKLLSDNQPVENLVGQEKVATVHSAVEQKPYFEKLTQDEVQQEIDYFKKNGEFHIGIDIGFGTGVHGQSGKSVKPFVTELTDQQLDELEAGNLPDLQKLKGQKLLGFTNPQQISVFRRLTPEELAAELKNYAENKSFSSRDISIGHAAEREIHKKEFHRPLAPLKQSEQELLIATGDIGKRQNILQAQRLVCHTPEIPRTPVFETKFSTLELAFDSCPLERQELYAQYRKKQDERQINRIRPEQVAMIKALQASGKGPKIDRTAYLVFTARDAEAYIRDNEQNPENTFPVTLYPARASTPTAAFPGFKKSNLLAGKQADYLQRSILRDLIAEGHLATPETRKELLEKLDYITSEQAKSLIQLHLYNPAGAGLLGQCRAYIQSGRIVNPAQIRTISDVIRLYQTNRSLDFDTKAVLRDLISGGYIHSNDAMAKIQFTTQAQDEALIAKYGDAPIGPNLRARISDMIDNAEIGSLDDEDFQDMPIKKAMKLIADRAELDLFKGKTPLASEAQKDLLKRMEQNGSIDLSKVDLTRLTAAAADQLIHYNLSNAPRYAEKTPATIKQKNYLKVLVAAKLLPEIPYDEWKTMTMARASELIASVPKEKRDALARNPRPPSAPHREAIPVQER